jgi:hypothetical protein
VLPFAAVGTVLDVAALALAVVVSASLLIIAWTLGVTAVQRVRRSRPALAATRADLARQERQVQHVLATWRKRLARLAERTNR